MSKVVDIASAKLGFHDQLIGAIPRLRRFAQTLTGSSHDRDDLVQTTLERAMVKRQQWSQQRPLESLDRTNRQLPNHVYTGNTVADCSFAYGTVSRVQTFGGGTKDDVVDP